MVSGLGKKTVYSYTALIEKETLGIYENIQVIENYKKNENAVEPTKEGRPGSQRVLAQSGFVRYKAILDEKGNLHDLKILEINQIGARLIGLNYDEVSRKALSELHSESPNDLLDSFKKVFTTNEEQILEKFDPVARKWYLSKITKPTVDELLVTFLDITQRKLKEGQVYRSQTLMCDMLNSSSQRIFALDKEQAYILVNDKEAKCLGALKSEILGKTPKEFLQKESANRMAKTNLAVIETGLELQFKEIIEIDGELHTFLTNKFPLKDNSAQIYGVGVISSDISNYVQRERELSGNDNIFLALFENASYGIAVVNSQGEILRTNIAYQNISGLKDDELLLKPFTICALYKDSKIERSLFKQLLSRQKDHYELERPFIRKDGSLRWGHVIGRLVFCKDKSPLLIVAVEDITQRKSIDSKLERHRKNLENLVIERTNQLNSFKRQVMISQAAGIVGQQLLLKYIFRNCVNKDSKDQ